MIVTTIREDGYIETYENVESIYYSKVDGRRLVIKQRHCVDKLPCQKIISVNCCFTRDEVRELRKQ